MATDFSLRPSPCQGDRPRQGMEDCRLFMTDFPSPSTAASSSPLPSCGLVSSSRAASEPPSSPLSDLAKTPPLPNRSLVASDAARRYPSPASLPADVSGVQTPTKRGQRWLGQSDHVEIRLGDAIVSSPRPSKRRKTTTPKKLKDADENDAKDKDCIPNPKDYNSKDRSTKYLNLIKSQHEFTAQDNHQMNRLLSVLRKKKKIVVIAGAGISVSAGIPDFRSSNGLFATTKKQYNVKSSGKHLFDASVYKHTSSTQSFHNMIREMSDMSDKAHPTPFHHLLASLAQEGRLLRLYSQNIDCLDTCMKPLETTVPLNPKGPWPKTIQLHGGLRHMVCTKCSQLSPFQADIFDGPEPPLCTDCQLHDQVRTLHAGKRSHGIGRLRPRFVLYNEYNPDEEAIGNVSSADLRARPDAVIVVGTTLKVPGTRRLVKELCQVVRSRKDGFTAWINPSPEPKGADLKDCWDMVVQSKCDSVARLAALPPWNVEIGDDYLVSKDEIDSKTNIEISLPSTPPLPSDDMLETASSSEQESIVEQPAQQLPVIPTPIPSPKPAAAVVKSKQVKLVFGGDKGPSKRKKVPNSRSTKTKQARQTHVPRSLVMDSFKASKNIATVKVEGKIMKKTTEKTIKVKTGSSL